MAEVFPDEWVDHLLGQVPRADHATNFPVPATTHMGLFTAGTSSTVPARTTVLGTTAPAAVTEPSGTGYARVSMAAAVWGAQGAIVDVPGGPGRKLTASQQTFPESGAAWNTSAGTPVGVIKGFFIANSAFAVAGKALYYANFDDLQAIDINAAGYTIRITPFYQINN